MLPTLQILQQAQTTTTRKEELTQKLECFLTYEEKIRSQFGLGFLNKMENAWDELHAAELDDAYEAGFLAAWKLWAEVSSIAAEYP